MPEWISRLIGMAKSRAGRRRDPDAELAEEIRLHLERRIQEFVDRGLSPEQAKAAAYRQFGPVEPVKEACRDERRRAVLVGTVWQDLRYGVRSLARDRAFTITALVSLTLGVGLVTSFVTVLNGGFLRPWPLPDPHTLVRTTRGVSPATYYYMHDRAASVDLVAMATCLGFIDDDLKGSGFRCVSGNYFDVLGVPLIRGRGFRPDEDVVGAPGRVVVIGDAFWRDRFERSPDVIGRTIRLNQVPFEVVGVAAAGARDEPAKNLPTLWVPLAAHPLLTPDTDFSRGFLTDPERCCVALAGRLRDPSRARVSAELTGLRRQFRGSADGPGGITVTGTRPIEQPWESSGIAIGGLLMAAVVLVLAVACANIGNLQLARGSRRQNELLVRLSLGANRGRLVRQLLTENALLAVAAAATSLGVASVLAASLARWASDGNADDFGIDLSPDWRVALFAALVAAIAVLATALGPALRSTGRLVTPGRAIAAPVRARAWLVVVQVGLSAILIVGASLLARNLMRAASLDPGFDADGVAAVSVRLPHNQGRDRGVAAVQAAARDAVGLQRPPVLAEAGPVRLGPVSVADGSGPMQAVGRSVSPDFLSLLNVPLREGRLLSVDDSPAHVVVNETFARRAWPGRSAIGAMFVAAAADASSGAARVGEPTGAHTPRVVVGVIGDMRQGRPGTSVQPTFFERGDGGSLYVRNDVAVIDRVRAAMQAVDPTVGVGFQPLSASFDVGLVDMRVGVGLAWALGLVALAMAATGVFGVFAVVAEERRREVGIHLALGADVLAVIRLMLTHAGRAIAIGLGVGFVGALLAAPLLRRYLVAVAPHDPLAFAVAALILTAAAAGATVVPIRRALRVDPAITLRAE